MDFWEWFDELEKKLSMKTGTVRRKQAEKEAKRRKRKRKKQR